MYGTCTTMYSRFLTCIKINDNGSQVGRQVTYMFIFYNSILAVKEMQLYNVILE